MAKIAKVGKKCRDLRLSPLRAAGGDIGLVKEIARAKEHQVRFGQHHAFGHIRLDDGGGRNLFGEVGRLVDIHLAGLGGAAANAERQVVLVEDVGQALDLAEARDSEDDVLAVLRELTDLLRHRRDRAMEAGCGLRLEDEVLDAVARLDAKLLDADDGQGLQALAPLLGREIQLFGTNEIADQAALVRFFHLRPPGIVRVSELLGLVDDDLRVG